LYAIRDSITLGVRAVASQRRNALQQMVVALEGMEFVQIIDKRVQVFQIKINRLVAPLSAAASGRAAVKCRASQNRIV
jgi:hypothetical protein